MSFVQGWNAHIPFLLSSFWRDSPPPLHRQGARASSFPTFLDQTQWHTTVGRPSLDDWSARRLDLYLHNTQHSQQTSMPPCGIRTHDLSRRAAADLRLRQRDLWDLICCICFLILFHVFIARVTWCLATNSRFALQMDIAVLDSFLLVRIKQERHHNAARISFR